MRDEAWDAIVVGSGATGGTAAWKLTQAGLRVLVLEAGGPVRPADHRRSFASNSGRALFRHLVTNRQEVQKHHPTYWATNPDFFADDRDNPYSTPEDQPFRWIRGGRVGGRTLTWDAVTLRMSDYEFKAASADGYGEDWPLCHDDLAPYYAEIEQLLGVYGRAESMPQIPDGEFAGHKEMTPGERHFKERVESTFGDRRVVISRGLNADRRPEAGDEHSRISSVATTLKHAQATGLLEVRPYSRVARVLLDETERRVCGVELVDTNSGERVTCRAGIVFLCASTIESVRVLLNSRTSRHPEGVGGNGGMLGRYLMDHSAGNVYFTLPEVEEGGSHYEFSGAASILVPRYQNLGGQSEEYRRGFGVWGAIQRMPVPGFLRKQRRVAFGFLCGRSEVLPHFDNHVRIDPHLKDRWGIPSVHIRCTWREDDRLLAAAARRDTEEMVRVAGGVPGMVTDHFHTPFVRGLLKRIEKEWTLSTPGMFVHEVGGARMGTDPLNSVVDSYGAVWDVENLYVTDGACWVTSGWQNPTLTEMAITARASERAAGRLRASSGEFRTAAEGGASAGGGARSTGGESDIAASGGRKAD